MTEIERRETQWAVADPDVYSGPRCDRVRPRWYCWAAGDKGGGDYQFRSLGLDAKIFPPGTKVTIAEPLCPGCKELREPTLPWPKHPPFYAAKCRCGFDWEEWTRDEFS